MILSDRDGTETQKRAPTNSILGKQGKNLPFIDLS